MATTGKNLFKVRSLKLGQGKMNYVSVGPADTFSTPLVEGQQRTLFFHLNGNTQGQFRVLITASRYVVVEPDTVVLHRDSREGSCVITTTRGGVRHQVMFRVAGLASIMIRPQEIVFTTPPVERPIFQQAVLFLAYCYKHCRRDAFIAALRILLNTTMTPSAQC
eukprot:PhF_6_TR7908/c0_g1_i2/m.11757